MRSAALAQFSSSLARSTPLGGESSGSLSALSSLSAEEKCWRAAPKSLRRHARLPAADAFQKRSPALSSAADTKACGRASARADTAAEPRRGSVETSASAPARMSARTTSAWPRSAASMSAVRPEESPTSSGSGKSFDSSEGLGAQTSSARMTSTSSALPECAAAWSADQPVSASRCEPASAPRRSNSLHVGALPPLHALSSSRNSRALYAAAPTHSGESAARSPVSSPTSA
mmetsp:Transcript_21683/g.77252  ORF Transcript_21683/g.77252 Transcript_21683/m.77252 type:complete len:232 (-) Transcript_21683:542-1237(-)